MGKITDFSITFTNKQLVYYPDQTISGYVNLHLDEPKNVSCVRVTFKGKASSHWKDMSDDTQKMIDCKHKETIIKKTCCVYGSIQKDTIVYQHPAGKHSYPFSFQLPHQTPSSFEGRHGYIRYTLKACIERAWKFNHKLKQPVVINDVIDPNLEIYASGVGGERNRDVGCLCGTMGGGSLDMTANIERTCYCPGEAILINSNVVNLTSKHMKSLNTKLEQIVTYKAKGRHKVVKKAIATLTGPVVKKGEYAAWIKQPFAVPATPPTISSNVLTVDYKLHVCVGVPVGTDLLIELPIIIGTIPYIPTYGKPVRYGTPEDPQGPPDANYCHPRAECSPLYTSFFGYPEMDPPSYSSVVGETSIDIRNERGDEYTFGDLKYRPLYAFANPVGKKGEEDNVTGDNCE